MVDNLQPVSQWKELQGTEPIEIGHFYFLTFNIRGTLWGGLADEKTVRTQFYNAEQDAYHGPYTYFDIVPGGVQVYRDRTDIDYGLLVKAIRNDAGVGSIGEFVTDVTHAWSRKIPGYIVPISIKEAPSADTTPPSPPPPPPKPNSPWAEAVKWGGIGITVLGIVYLVRKFWPSK